MSNDDIFNLSHDQIIQKYSKLVKSIAHKYSKYGTPLEDVEQEAFIGLLEAVKHYKSDQGAQFQTYAVFWIKKRIFKALNLESKHFKQTEYRDELINDDIADPTPDFAQQKETQLNLSDQIPDIEQLVLRKSYEEKKSLNQIAEELNIPREKVRQIKQKAMRRFKNEVLKKNQE